VCAHAVRVAIKNIEGVQSVDVSLSNGLAMVVFAPGNHVRYEQLLAAIDKNGFVVKGAKMVADGTIENNGGTVSLRVSGSNDLFRLTGENLVAVNGNRVQVEGDIPEIGKGKRADTIQSASVRKAE
jgi:copper chaperone CopZ